MKLLNFTKHPRFDSNHLGPKVISANHCLLLFCVAFGRFFAPLFIASFHFCSVRHYWKQCCNKILNLFLYCLFPAWFLVIGSIFEFHSNIYNFLEYGLACNVHTLESICYATHTHTYMYTCIRLLSLQRSNIRKISFDAVLTHTHKHSKHRRISKDFSTQDH